MDACIARGGISHVLSQARASLKKPSRPFTPQSSSRPLFHGDDYRPGSRPSSSYTMAELKQMAQQQQRTPLVPIPTSGLKARPPVTSQSHEKITSASLSSLKLVHAPILSDDDSEDELSTADFDTENVQATQFDPEASLSLPSNDELVQSYEGIERCVKELLDRAEAPDFITEVGRLRELVDSFVGLSSFLQAGSKAQSVEDAAAAKLRVQLFDKLSNVLLENWATNAECVLELAPSLLALYGSCSDDSDETSAQIIQLGKTLFVLSKDSENDGSFCNVRYVEAILHAIADTSDQSSGRQDDKHSEDSDDAITLSSHQQKIPIKALIYATGTLKNISNAEDKMARLLATNRAIAILSETMLWRGEDGANSKEIAQFLIQTTGILRNLSVAKNNHKQFLEARIPLRLCGMIPSFIVHQELMVNISRILSKLTLHELPRAQINQNSTNVQNLVALIDHRENSWLSLVDQQRSDMRLQDLLFIRVFFVLGNLCAGNDQNRRLIATNSGISVILEVLQFYAARYSDARSSETTDEKEERRCAVEGEQAMEVLIKLVRVVANLAINAGVGAQLNGYDALTPLLETLEVSQRVGDEELMLNTVSCITNVSYYSTAPASDSKGSAQNSDYCFIESNRVAITQLLARILLDRNEEAVVEAARAFGNLSRFKDVLGYMSDLKVLECLVVLLDHSNREVVYTVCGVLMNAALDQNTRQTLLSVRPMGDNNGVDVRTLLVGIVECAAVDDLDMTLIASKALYNLLLSKDVAAGDNTDHFTSDAMNLRRTIEEVLGAISNNQLATRGSSSKGDNEPNEDEDATDSWSSRQELRLVLPQLLRSVNSVINAM
ncbi:hypothetical protein PC129_g11447 [Phytophthora cactorum]|uniref:Armadillo-type fold n=1 Tax=Phytophthora cactorum TaxID=29920 RepID=A0A329RW46_9STRA|nr:hypothetical protein Pcac1_g19763 [Phytophthora cactorum]KAG2819154.1 hypothetical protein PC111_g12005 [Phytophthora cactorum]KAG2823255.1 hypothetical protein PC112_g10593 [Phytophthora cactorum]KAG2855826.1 hypothetical protein PC113_g12108 [Phytophthora cactorum]KAG2899037.1 hypothetical protein PC114_g14058 [Phytophthora cactorum]